MVSPIGMLIPRKLSEVPTPAPSVKTLTKTRINRSDGKTRKTSVILMRTLSVHEPKYPATAPTRIAIAMVIKVTTTPT